MASVVELYNLALSAVGTRALVSSPSEASREAEICTLWYPTARDSVLRAAPWPSARAAKRLALQVERDVDKDWTLTDPEPGWRFAYSTPSDMIAPRYLSNFDRFAITINAENAKTLVTNTENAILIYTKRQEQVQLWDVSLYTAVAYALGAHIALALHGKPDRAQLLQEQANALIMQARLDAANSTQEQHQTLPDWIAARQYAGAAPPPRFIYEYGPLLAVTDGVGVS